MNEELDRLKKENEDLLFKNNVLQAENDFMKANIKRIYTLYNVGNSAQRNEKISIYRRLKNKLKRIIK